ncbi:MAG: ABC transporter ATP-binding protein [Thermodesulfobacteriota bacterium]|jgi:branched-chain amino acid transport system ATP-binding protein
MSSLLEGKKVSKHFGGLPAVDGVDFHIAPGEICGFIGPNGAGKTTLINLITGVFPVTGGEIWFRGQNITNLPSHVIGKMGLARTYQVAKPFSGMTVRENVLIGALHGKSGRGKTMGEASRKAEEIMELLKLMPKRNIDMAETTIPDRKKVELAKALAMDPELLLLDEVMGGLNSTEVEGMMEIIQTLRKMRRITVLVIEHVMKAIMGISDRVVVLHHGRKICEGTPGQITCDEKVIKAYLGERYAKAKAQEGNV